MVKFFAILKKITIIATVISAITGAVLGIYTTFNTFRDPKAEAGYDEHSKMIEENSKNINKNREEIRYLYRSSMFRNNNLPKEFLPNTPVQKSKEWNKLHIKR